MRQKRLTISSTSLQWDFYYSVVQWNPAITKAPSFVWLLAAVGKNERFEKKSQLAVIESDFQFDVVIVSDLHLPFTLSIQQIKMMFSTSSIEFLVIVIY